MMQNSILMFKKQLSTISQHNECFSLLPTILKIVKETNINADKIIEKWTNERIFNYRSNIISLYGCFEQFIESSVKEYVNELLKVCSNFMDLDNSIKNEYIEKWKALHGKLHYNKYQEITPIYMIESLYRSMIENKNEVIAECFLQNGGNYKHEEIMKVFSNLGFHDIRSCLKHYEPLASFFSKNGFDNYATIDELVERRNEIAHGVNSNNLVSESIVLDYIGYIEKYALSITEYLKDQIFNHLWRKRKAYAVYKPSNYYAKPSIVEFSERDVILIEGMDFLVKRTDGFYPRYLYGKLPIFRVKDMNVPNTSIQENKELYGDGNWMFSFHVHNKMTKQFRFAFYL